MYMYLISAQNLLSVNAITESGGEVLFTKEKVIVKHANKTIMKGKKLQNSLFQVKVKPQNEYRSYLAQKNRNKVMTWHRKMGHISHKNLKKLAMLNNHIDDLRESCSCS